MKTVTILAFLSLFFLKTFADPEPALIQAICEVVLKNGETVRGFMCIGVDHVATDGFYLDDEINKSHHHPILFQTGMIGFNLESGSIYHLNGNTNNRNFGKPKLYYLKDVTYNKHRTYQCEEIFNKRDGYIELIRKDIDKFILLDSLLLFDNLYNLFLNFDDQDLNTKARKIAIKDIKQFYLIIEPLEVEINEIIEAKERFLEQHKNEEEFEIYFPLWYHDVWWKYEGFRCWGF